MFYWHFRRTLHIALYILFTGLSVVAQVYRTQIFDTSIKTLRSKTPTDKYSSNMINLNSDEKLQFSFDQLSYDAHAYSYRVIHCNADWTVSSLSTTEFLTGFTTGTISDVSKSVNTTTLYTHYQFELPNTDMQFKISGNYVTQIYEDNQTENPIAQVCFSICDPKVTIHTKVRANTDIELNGKLQQVDFDVLLNGLAVQNPMREIQVFIRQNNRFDNEVKGIVPTYVQGNALSYVNNKQLIFEGGSEFHTFDISSVYAASRGVDAIRYMQPQYAAYLTTDKIQANDAYNQEFDADGKFVINLQRATDAVDVEADYMWVNFVLDIKKPFFDGKIYVGGDFNYNLMADQNIMDYDFKKELYFYRTLLKQGGYNYQYRFRDKASGRVMLERVDGSYWQTTNEYSIFI
ncbi:MAG: hypothetical protein AUK44_09185, partial [Porphyromonadaceae bacterium CG2_30_38_12]